MKNAAFDISESHGSSILVDCADAPDDLRVAANVILSRAFQIHDEKNDDMPVVIEMGELHSYSSHGLLLQMVSQGLVAGNHSFVGCLELEHNKLAVYAEYAMDRPVEGALQYTPNDYDLRGAAAQAAFLAYDHLQGAPIAHRNLIAHWYANKVPAFFNDAANDGRGNMDLNDPVTARIAKGIDQNNMSEVFKARNVVSAELGIKKADEYKADFILQSSGSAHVYGWRQAGVGFDTSLVKAYQDTGAHVLPVFITSLKSQWDVGIIPDDAPSDLVGGIIVNGLTDETFESAEVDLDIEERELEFLERLNNASGDELEIYDTLSDIEATKIVAQRKLSAVVERYELGIPAHLGLEL